jgi:transcriptional regulator with XRE-family HTH domain
MKPDEIKALRKELGCTARELAAALGVEQATVLAWERGALFPTKRFVDGMQTLREKGPTAFARPSKASDGPDALRALADPALWALVRKLCAHEKLRAAATKLADAYPDPAED